MRFNIISNLENGAGLQKDCRIVQRELEKRGHLVHGVQFNDPRQVPWADVNLFIEVVVPHLFSKAGEQWLIPNPEWWFPHHTESLSAISRVLCKTKDCFRLVQSLAPERVGYIGFMSNDLDRPDVKKLPQFLHVAGKSIVKNTEAILTAWRTLTYPLTIVTSLNAIKQRVVAEQDVLKTVTVRQSVPENEFVTLMNEHQFHLCPSKYEGFGHYLHEGMSVGAVIITTDAPPMNEFGLPSELLVPPKTSSQLRMAQLHDVYPEDILAKVQFVAGAPHSAVEHWSRCSRQLFERECEDFRHNLSSVLNGYA